MKSSAGIYGIGVYLPEQIRTNDWWSREIIESWTERASAKLDRAAAPEEDVETTRIVLEEMGKLRGDNFKGSRERRIMPDGMLTSQMEHIAAKRAVEAAGIDAQEIGLVLSTTSTPDYLMIPNACKVHETLGLSRRCLSLQTEGVCNAFPLQLALAEQMIAGGAAKHALLIQSSGVSRFLRREDPMSAWFGDAATAVVVGPVSSGFGVLGRYHETDGAYCEGIVCGIPKKRWWQEGSVQAYLEKPEIARRMLLETIYRSKTVIHGALADAGMNAGDVDFYAAHQGFAWLRPATQRIAGLEHARTIDTFHWAASVLGSNMPLVLAMGEKEGLLRHGDRVAMFAGAAGATLSSIVLRWGR